MSFQSPEGAGSGAEAEGSGDEGGDASKKTYEEDAQVESRARWRHVAGEKVRKGVDLVALPRSDKLLYEALLGSRAFTRAIDPATYRIFLYNAKTDGECKSQPKIRLPVLRAAYMHRVVHAALRARNTQTEGSEDGEPKAQLEDNDLFLFMDAFKHDNKNVFLGSFASADKSMKKVK